LQRCELIVHPALPNNIHCAVAASDLGNQARDLRELTAVEGADLDNLTDIARVSGSDFRPKGERDVYGRCFPLQW
jgi:hypothetical protein